MDTINLDSDWEDELDDDNGTDGAAGVLFTVTAGPTPMFVTSYA